MSKNNASENADSNPQTEMPLESEAAAPSGPKEAAQRVETESPAQEDRDLDAAQAAEAPVSMELQLEEALARMKAWEEEYLRARAEMENLRRRSAQEVLNASKFAIESFAEALLPVADSLEMALSLPNQTLDGLRGGVDLTLKQLHQAFQKGRLTPIDPKGEKFDPNRHQAVSMVDGATQDPPVPSNHVVAVMQKGYLVADRVLRPAIVVVAQ